MTGPLAEDARGQLLLAVHPAATLTAAHAAAAPCPLALAVVSHRGAVLFGLNRWRREWELPGGILDDGESARSAAAREIAEETGVDLSPDRLRFAGLASFALVGPTRRELAAVFVAELDTWAAPHPSDEFVDVRWIDLSAPPEPCSAIDLALARRVRA